MLALAKRAMFAHDPSGVTFGDASLPLPIDECDMHELHLLDRAGTFDGAYSFKSLLMHTPEEYVGPALEDVAKLLKYRGIFSVTYAPGDTRGEIGVVKRPHDLLTATLDGTLNYFSFPSTAVVQRAAARAHLCLLESKWSDGVHGGVVLPDYFVTQLYRKL